MIMNSFIKENLLTIIMGFILSMISFFNIYPKIILGGDIEAIFLYPDSFISKGSTLWNQADGFGALNSIVANLPIYYFAKILRFFLSHEVANQIFYSLLFSFAYFAAVYFIKKINLYYLKNNLNYKLISIIAIYYIFNLQFLQLNYRAIPYELISFILFPYGLGLYIDYLKNNKLITHLKILPLIMLGMNIAHFIIFLLLILIFMIGTIVYKNNKKEVFKYTLYFLISIFLISLFWIIPLFIFYKSSYAQISSDTHIISSTIEAEFILQRKYHTILNLMQGYNQGYLVDKNFFPIIDNRLIQFFNFAFILLITSILIVANNYRKITLILFGFYLFVLIILSGANGIMGNIFQRVILEVPGMLMFRSVHTKFNYIVLILQLTILAIIIAELKQKYKLSFYKIILIILILIIPCTKFTFNLYDEKYAKTNINPVYLKEIDSFKKIAQQENLKSGFFLPNSNLQWATFTNMGFWGYSLFQQSSIGTGFHTIGTAGMNKKNYNFYYSYLTVPANELDLVGISSKGVNFLIYQKDFNYNFSNSYVFKNDRSLIEKFLQNNKDFLKLIQTNEYFEVYKIYNLSEINK